MLRPSTSSRLLKACSRIAHAEAPMLKATRRKWAKILGYVLPILAALMFAMGWWNVRADRLAAESEAALYAAREQALVSLLEGKQIGYAILDFNSRVIRFNPALVSWTDYTEEEMLGKDILALMPAEARDRHQAGYAQIINDKQSWGKTFKVECQLIPKNAAKPPIDVEVSAHIVKPKGRDAKPCAVAIIVRKQKIVELSEGKE